MTLRLEKDNKKVRDQSSRQRRYTWSDELRVSCATAKKASPHSPPTHAISSGVYVRVR